MKTNEDLCLFDYFTRLQKEFEALRDKYARGSASYNLNDGKASAFQMLAGDVKAGESPISWRQGSEVSE